MIDGLAADVVITGAGALRRRNRRKTKLLPSNWQTRSAAQTARPTPRPLFLVRKATPRPIKTGEIQETGRM